MSHHRIRLYLALAAVGGTAIIVTWQMLAFVAELRGVDANPLVRRPVIPPPPLEEIAPPDGVFELRQVSYPAGTGDAPGWRIPADNGPLDTHLIAPPWRGSDETVWRQALGGQGNSTPIVVGTRIYFTIADGGPTLWLVCFNLVNGFGVWRQPVSREPFPSRHEKTSDAASTPCSDGARVFVAHAAANTVHLTAFSLDGQALWTTKLGPFTARWGFTCSPAYARGLVIVGADNAQEGFLAAVDGESGQVVWRRRRPSAGDESYSSPIVIGADSAEPQVVVAGLDRIESHELGSGRKLWSTDGISSTATATPLVAGDICVATSGYPSRAMVALRIATNQAKPALLWKEGRDSEIPYVPTPLVHNDRLYVLHDDGMAHCRDLATGKVAWKRRVGGVFSASPVLVNGELLCADESGRCTLLSLDDGKVQHEFSLSGGCFATPVAVRGRLVIRSTKELIAFDVAPR